MTTASGPDILSYFLTSEARWSPGHWVWLWVCRPSLGLCWSAGSFPRQPTGAAAVACSFLFAFQRTEWRVGWRHRELLLGRKVVSACQEEPLTHRRCIPVSREKWSYQQVPRGRPKEVGSSEHPLSSENPSALLIIASVAPCLRECHCTASLGIHATCL